MSCEPWRVLTEEGIALKNVEVQTKNIAVPSQIEDGVTGYCLRLFGTVAAATEAVA